MTEEIELFRSKSRYAGNGEHLLTYQCNGNDCYCWDSTQQNRVQTYRSPGHMLISALDRHYAEDVIDFIDHEESGARILPSRQEWLDSIAWYSFGDGTIPDGAHRWARANAPAGAAENANLAVSDTIALYRYMDWPGCVADIEKSLASTSDDPALDAALAAPPSTAQVSEWGSPVQGRTQQDVLRAIMTRHGLSGARVGQMVGVDGRSVRRWLADPESRGFRWMPYAAWHTLIAKLSK